MSPHDGRPVVLGVAGGSGSGKTSIAHAIRAESTAAKYCTR